MKVALALVFLQVHVAHAALRGNLNDERQVSNQSVKQISLLSDQKRAAVEHALTVECKTSTAISSHGVDKCWDLCKGSQSCLSVCDEMKSMVCDGGIETSAIS